MRLLLVNPNTLKSLERKRIEGGIIPLRQADLTNSADGMESYFYQRIRGRDSRELIKQIKEALNQIGTIFRDELTVESICFQLIAPENLLFCEYQQIKDEFYAFRRFYQLSMIEGVILDDKEANNGISLAIFYFNGVVDLTSGKKTNESDSTDLVIPNFLRRTDIHLTKSLKGDRRQK